MRDENIAPDEHLTSDLKGLKEGQIAEIKRLQAEGANSKAIETLIKMYREYNEGRTFKPFQETVQEKE